MISRCTLAWARRGLGVHPLQPTRWFGYPKFRGTFPIRSRSSSPLARADSPFSLVRLENGLRVVSVDTQRPNAMIGAFVAAGSRYEVGRSELGLSRLYEHMSFKSTENRSCDELIRTLERIGSNCICTSSRDSISLCMEFLPDDLPLTVDILADAVQRPVFAADEIQEQLDVLRCEREKLMSNPELLLQEVVHQAAFGEESPLGRPHTCIPSNSIEELGTLLRDYHSRLFSASRTVIVAAGVPQEELVKLVSQRFEHYEEKADFNDPESRYRGGTLLLSSQSVEPSLSGPKANFFHTILVFEGAALSSQDVHKAWLVQTLLGGGQSFSQGGPGKGLYSRLYCNVLRNRWADSALAFNLCYSDTGLFGIQASANREDYAAELLLSVASELLEATRNISSEELLRAKNMLKALILTSLETHTVFVDDIGRQLLLRDRYENTLELCEQIDKLTHRDLEEFVRARIRIPPTLVAVGLPHTLKNIPTAKWLSEQIRAILK